MRSLSGKAMVVTGAASGIGASIARRLCREGARVLLTDIDEKEGRAVAEALSAEGGGCGLRGPGRG